MCHFILHSAFIRDYILPGIPLLRSYADTAPMASGTALLLCPTTNQPFRTRILITKTGIPSGLKCRACSCVTLFSFRLSTFRSSWLGLCFYVERWLRQRLQHCKLFYELISSLRTVHY
ncbi:unnamed protein product [Laminaria digitata]